MDEHHDFPSYVNVPPIAKTRSTSHLAPTPEHHRSVSYEESTTASTSTDSGVRIRSESSQVSCDSPIPAPRKYVAAYEYVAQKEDELDLPLGSIVKLITDETQEDGWFRGELEGRVGLFPSNYARLLPETDNLVELTAEEIQLPGRNSTLDDHQIGHGATATVFKVEIRTRKELQGGQMVDGCIKAALKRFHRYTFRADSHNELEQLKREANLVNGLSHNNIVRLLGICLEDPYFGLLLELCEGFSLRSVVRDLDQDKPIPLGVLIDWAGQVAKGMAYLTKEGYVHRDLKADNVLVKEEVCKCFDQETMKFEWCTKCGRRPLDKLQLKITDFGVSRKVTADANRLSTAGTYAWLAPEAFRYNEWSEASDVWSYGVVLWELLSREEPYQGQIPAAIAFQVAKNGQSLKINESFPPKWKDIMQQCWALDKEQRPKFQHLVKYFEDYARELEEQYVHIQRAPSIMAVKEIYTGVNKTNELEKMFRELYSETGFNRKNRQSIAPETTERKIYKGHKGKRPEITGPIGEVKHVFSVQKSNDKASDKGNFRIKYNDEVSTGGTLPRLNGKGMSTLSISSPDLYQLPEIVSGSSTIGSSASKISRQRAIRKKKNSHHNAFESPVVSPTMDQSGLFATIENADEVNEPSASKEKEPVVKNGTLSKVFSKLPWRSHKRDSKDDEDKAGSISSRSSSTTSSHRIITGPATRGAAAPPFLDAGARSRAQSAADCWDETYGKKNKVSPADKRPVKQTNLTERFVKDPDVLRPSILPSYHRKSALDQTIPPSPKASPDSNFQPMQLNAGRRTTTTSSSDGAASYETLVTQPGAGHGRHIIQPSLSDYVPIASEQPTHYYMTNGHIYEPNVRHQNTVAHNYVHGHGHGKPTYYPVGGGCDDYIPVAGTGHMKPTVGEVNNSPYAEMSTHLSGRNIHNPQYVQCKATPKTIKVPTIPVKIQSESNLGGMAAAATSTAEQLNGIGTNASSLSLNEPPIFQAPLPPRVSMSPPTRLAPVLPPVSPKPRGIMDEEILKKPEVMSESVF